MFEKLFAVLLSIASSNQPNLPQNLILPSSKQVHCLAETIYHEARGEPIAGQRAVGNVVLNRVQSNKFPDTICKVVYQPKQFSWVGHVKKPKENDPAFIKSKMLASGLIMQRDLGLIIYPMPMYNATFFSREPIKLKFNKLKYLGMIGHHKFYELTPLRG